MKRIGIYLQSGPACGGTYQYNRIVLDALLALPEDEFEVYALYGTPHWKKILEDKRVIAKQVNVNPFWQKAMGLWRRVLPVSLWRGLVAPFHPLMKEMKKLECALWIFPSQDALAYWLPVEALSVVHDLMHRYEQRFPEVGNKKEYNIREFHYQQMCEYSKGILVDSTLGKTQLIESYEISPAKCHVLPYIAPPSLWERSDVDISYQFSLPEKFFFYPAQFWQHKNHENLLKALKMCQKRHPDMQLVLVGSPKNHYSAILKLIDELSLKPNVKMYGLVDDAAIPQFYRRARALIMPTFFGPTNIPPLEAFALGCPVAISGIYGMKAQLQDAALYFDPNSAKEIAVKMIRLWEDDALCQSLIEKGKAHYNKWNFSHFIEHLRHILHTCEH